MRYFTLLLALYFSTALQALDTAAGMLPDGGGLVIFKEQAFLADNLAAAMLFTKSIQRGPTSTLFVGLEGERALVPSDGILGVFASEEINISELSTGQKLDQYRSTMARLEQLGRLNAKVASVTTPVVERMRTNVAMVESGKELVNGEWKSNASAVEASTPPPPQLDVKQPHLNTLTTTEGDSYRNVTYKSSDDKKVSFFHEDGVTRISWDKLKKDDQLRWGYDAEKITSENLAKDKTAALAKQIQMEAIAKAEKLAQQSETEARARADEFKQKYLAQRQANQNAFAKIQALISAKNTSGQGSASSSTNKNSETPSSIPDLLTYPEPQRRDESTPSPTPQCAQLRFQVDQVLDSGCLVERMISGPGSMISSSSASEGGGGGAVFMPGTYEASGNVVYLQGINLSNIVEHQRIIVPAYRDGTYKYKGTDGVRHTVEQWTAAGDYKSVN